MSAGRATLAAFVLHHWDWSESSLILDLFTREQGRVVAVAKGAKKPHSNLRAVLLPFQRIAVTLGRAGADGEIQNLRAAEWAAGAAMPHGSSLFSGFYASELVMKLLARHDPHPVLWDAYARLVARLPIAEAAALRAFELVLLRETGVLPELALQTQTQQPVQPGRAYALRPESGLVAAGDGGIDGAWWRCVRDALARDDAQRLEGACAEAAAPLRRMLRELLHYHLGSSTLRTRDVLRSLQDLAA
jgi:DNA repair protein RecO (recombination protein O)